MRGRPVFVSLLAVMILAVAVDAWQGFPLAGRFLDGPLLENRVYLWDRAWLLFKRSPWLGHGLHTFSLNAVLPWPHNLFLETLAEQGILGLTSLCALLGSLLVTLQPPPTQYPSAYDAVQFFMEPMT